MGSRPGSGGPRLPSWAVVTEPRRAHIARVAALLTEWAGVMAVEPAERELWLRAAYLHDALRDLPPTKLAELAPDACATPALRHGPAAAAMAARHGETDAGVLSAVRYHTVGFAGWNRVGRMLYLADYLEPGRPDGSETRRGLASRAPLDPDGVLRQVAAERLIWSISQGRPLLPETVEFWNGLIG